MFWFTLLSSHSTKETGYLVPEKVWRYPLVGLDSGMNAILLLPWRVWLWEGRGKQWAFVDLFRETSVTFVSPAAMCPS